MGRPSIARRTSSAGSTNTSWGDSLLQIKGPGGDFYTPRNIVRLMVELIEPYQGRVYDPCCGSGGMFMQSEKFVDAYGGKRNDIAVYGQESNDNTWRLGKMNLAIRGIEGDLGPRWADTFHEDLHRDLKADYILANRPFNISDWEAPSYATTRGGNMGSHQRRRPTMHGFRT